MAGSHCHHCLALVQACVPCVWCSQVNFCSAFCRDAACSSYHAEGAECRLSELLLKEAGVNENAAKAFRLVTRFGLSHLRKCLLDDDNQVCKILFVYFSNSRPTIVPSVIYYLQIISPDPTWGAEKGDDGSGFVYESLDLINAFHHFGAASDDDDGDAELVLSAVAVFLVECLRQLTKYFPGKASELPPPTSIYECKSRCLPWSSATRPGATTRRSCPPSSSTSSGSCRPTRTTSALSAWPSK